MTPLPERGPRRTAEARLSQRFRSVLFWIHLAAGVVAGAVIFILSLTGLMLSFERQITEWADRSALDRPQSPASAPRLPLEALLAKVPGRPTSVTVTSEASGPVAVSLGREKTLFLDPRTGEVLGEGAPRVRAFFRKVTDWHRALGASGERRELGRALTGACNLAFLVLVVSGLYLWLPRRFTWSQVRAVLWFRGGLAGKARDFNWHNVIGLWSWVPLFLIVVSGVVISYPWASSLVYLLVGEEAPARQGPPGGERGGRGERGRRGGEEPEEPALDLSGLDRLLTVAEGRVTGWQSLSFRLPETAEDPVSFSILSGPRGRPDLRAQLTLTRATGEVEKWEPYESQSPGRKLRTWLRWIHTGEAGGVAGQVVAGLASGGAVVLVWTGIALALRRLAGARRRSKSNSRPAGQAVSIRGASQEEPS